MNPTLTLPFDILCQIVAEISDPDELLAMTTLSTSIRPEAERRLYYAIEIRYVRYDHSRTFTWASTVINCSRRAAYVHTIYAYDNNCLEEDTLEELRTAVSKALQATTGLRKLIIHDAYEGRVPRPWGSLRYYVPESKCYSATRFPGHVTEPRHITSPHPLYSGLICDCIGL